MKLVKHFEFKIEPISGFIVDRSIIHGFKPVVIQIKSFQDLTEQNYECGLI
jgi:hypothetical protein